MTLKIEVGKYYRTRNGQKVGPMRETGHPSGTLFERFGDGRAWSNDGSTVHADKRETLVAEWTEEPEAAHFASREQMVSAIPGPAPDYNDGNWHGWNGGECPDSIHPASLVEFVWHCLSAEKAGLGLNDARVIMWAQVIRFRVVLPYTAPREGYAVTLFKSAREAKTAHPGCDPVFVREVK